MAWKYALNIGAISLILSLEAVAVGSFLRPAEALNSPANSVHRRSQPQLPLNWQTVLPAQPSGSRPNSQQVGASWNSFQPPAAGSTRKAGRGRNPWLRMLHRPNCLHCLDSPINYGANHISKADIFLLPSRSRRQNSSV
jgi:hypothetical protein